MVQRTIYTLPDSDIPVAGAQLSGINQGSGVHLVGATITLNSNAWVPVTIDESNTDLNFGDSDNSQKLAAPTVYDGVSYAAGRRVEADTLSPSRRRTAPHMNCLASTSTSRV